MKLDKGAINYSVLTVKDDQFWKTDKTDLIEAYSKHSFNPIPEESILTMSAGWVDPIDLYDSKEFRNCIVNTVGVMAIRCDEYKLPKERCEIMFQEKAKQQGYQDSKFSMDVKRQIKESIYAELKPKLLPATKVNYAFIDYEMRKIYVLSKSMKVVDLFMSLIEKTFDVSVKLENYTMEILEKTGMPCEKMMEWLYNKIVNNENIQLDAENNIVVESSTRIQVVSDTGTESMMKTSTSFTDEQFPKDTLAEGGVINVLRVTIPTENKLSYEFVLKADRMLPEAIETPLILEDGIENRIERRANYLSVLNLLNDGIRAVYIREIQNALDEANGKEETNG